MWKMAKDARDVRCMPHLFNKGKRYFGIPPTSHEQIKKKSLIESQNFYTYSCLVVQKSQTIFFILSILLFFTTQSHALEKNDSYVLDMYN